MKVTELKIGDKVKCYRYFTGEVVAISDLGVEVKIDSEGGTLDTYTCLASDLELIENKTT